MSRWALAVMACAAPALAACGGGGGPSASSGTSGTVRATSSSRAPASVTSTSRTTPSSTTTSSSTGTVGCTAVKAVAGPSQGAAGTITGVIVVTNTGALGCVAQGYPTISLSSSTGVPLTVTMVNGLSVSLSPAANAPPSRVALAPSASARFAFQFSDVPVGSATSCPVSATATVTMPGSDVASPSFPLAIAPCANGTVRVSPVYSAA